MMYEPEIHPTHILMDEQVAKSQQGKKMKNDLIERCSRNNTPALWIIENYHRKGHLHGDFDISPELAQQVRAFLKQKGLPEAYVTTQTLNSGYADGLKLEYLAKDVYGMIAEAEVAA